VATYAANQSDIGSLGSLLSGQADSLTGYKTQAEAATTQATYDKYKALFDSTKAEYEEGTRVYDELTSTYFNVATARSVESSMVDIPNFKDKNQWMPGGYLKNQTFAGGSMYGIDRIPSLDNKAPSDGSFSAVLLSGNMLTMLNKGFTSVRGTALGGVLDLISDFDVRSTTVTTYRVVVSMSDGSSHILQSGSYSDNSNGEGGQSGGLGLNSTGPMDLEAVGRAWGAQFDLRTVSPVGLSIQLSSMAWNGTLDLSSAQDLVGGALIGTVKNMISEKLTGALVNALGITSVPVAIAVSYIVGSVVSELAEIGLGLDNNFGFGGDIVGVDSSGQAHYAGAVGWGRGFYDMVMEAVTFGTHSSRVDEKAVEALDLMDRVNQAIMDSGYSNTTSLNNMSVQDVTGFSLEASNLLSEIKGYVTSTEGGLNGGYDFGYDNRDFTDPSTYSGPAEETSFGGGNDNGSDGGGYGGTDSGGADGDTGTNDGENNHSR
jgi:hypothetical protein